VKLLLEYGASPNSRDEEDVSVLARVKSQLSLRDEGLADIVANMSSAASLDAKRNQFPIYPCSYNIMLM
jgi:hypothetical protein